MLVVAGLIAILLPLLFLYIVYALDLYSSGSFRTVALCFAWGLVAFGLAYVVNTGVRQYLLMDRLGMDFFQSLTVTVILVAPIVEELLKSLILIYLGRRPDFTYFVDGAIYGFAVGIAFSILENFFYIAQAGGAGQGTMAVISRSFSTCLMHGSASALVGVSIGRFRYGHGGSRILSAFLGWAAAMLLHSGFNRVVEYWTGAAFLLGAVGMGIGGVVLIGLFIRWGLAEERRWIEETLSLEMGVTNKEKALVHELGDVERLLRPVKERFGKERAGWVEEFLVKQAQLGIKQKSSQLSDDPRLKAEVQAQIQGLQKEMEALRRKVGVYCMTYVRSIFPPESVVLWSNLEQLVQAAQQRPARFDMWNKLQDAASSRAETEVEG
jgi:RsiW-degrading membrane proteinase PrsW (M82 family)